MPAIPNVASVGVAIVPNMSNFGRQLSSGLPAALKTGLAGIAGIGGAVAGIIGTAVKEFVPLEATFARMVGLAGVAKDEIAGFQEEILKLAPAVGKAPQELADALLFITSSGFQGAAALEVLEASAKAGAAGLGDVAVIADAVTSAVNAYGPEVLSAARATDILVAGVREGKIEADQFAPVLGKLLPTASAMGIAFEDVAGILAAMSRTGFDAAEASTSLGAVMSTLLKPSVQAKNALEDAGLSMADLRDIAGKPGGLVEVMRILDGALGDNEEALSAVVPNVRAFRGVMNLLAQDASVVDQVLQGTRDSIGDTDEALAAVADTAEFRLAQAMAKLKVSLVEVGSEAAPDVIAGIEAMIPVLDAVISGALDFATGVKTIVEGFQSLPVPAQAAAAGVTGIYLALKLAGSHPIILGLTAVAGLITILGDRARDHKKNVDDLAESLGGLSDAEVALTRAVIQRKVIEAGILDDLANLGITVSTVTEAILGNVRARERLARTPPAFAGNVEAHKRVIAVVNELGLSYDEATEKQQATRRAQLEAAKDADLLTGSLLGTKDALEGSGDAADDAAGGFGDAADEAGTLADELDKAKEAGDGVIATLLDLTNPLFSAINRAVSLKDLIEEIDAASDTEPEGFRNAEEVAKYRQALLELAASLELANQEAGGANEALDIMAALFQTTRPELIDWLAEFGIVIDEFGNLGTAITEGVVAGAGNLQRDLTRSLDQQIAGTLATLRNKYEIRSPSGVWRRELGVPFRQGLIEPMHTAGRELQAAVTAAISQGMNQTVPRGAAPAGPVITGDTITIEEGAIQVHNARPERASESLQSAPLRMTLQGLVRR